MHYSSVGLMRLTGPNVQSKVAESMESMSECLTFHILLVLTSNLSINFIMVQLLLQAIVKSPIIKYL